MFFNEHVLKICKLVGSAIVGLFSMLIAIIGIAKEKTALDKETEASVKADVVPTEESK